MATNLGAVFLKWFYWDAPRGILSLLRDFLAWVWQMFSIGFFMTRIFSPWHRDLTGYGRGFDIKAWSQAIVYNGISRVAGAVLRTFFIVTGLLLEAVTLAAGIAIFMAWLVLPAIFAYLIYLGVAGT